MPQIDLKNMYLGSYFLANGNEKMYNEETKITSRAKYNDYDKALDDFKNGILRPGEKFEIDGHVESIQGIDGVIISGTIYTDAV